MRKIKNPLDKPLVLVLNVTVVKKVDEIAVDETVISVFFSLLIFESMIPAARPAANNSRSAIPKGIQHNVGQFKQPHL